MGRRGPTAPRPRERQADPPRSGPDDPHPGTADSTMTSETRLGEQLVERGLISRDTLQEALRRQRFNGKLLGEVLVEMGAVEEDGIRRTLTDVFGIEKLSPSELKADEETLDLLPRKLAKKYNVFPIQHTSNSITVATPDPLSGDARDEIQRVTRRFVKMRAASAEAVEYAIEGHYGQGAIFTEIEGRIEGLAETAVRQVEQRGTDDEMEAAETAAVIELIDGLLRLAVKRRASDLHIQPQEEQVETRLRVDGVLRPGPTLPKEIQPVVTTRLKIMGDMDISESRMPQDGRSVTEVDGQDVDMRLSSFPVMYGENLVVRLLQKDQLVRGLGELGMNPDQLSSFRKLATSPNGILLVTGPTGSGKTTTLYSTLQEMDSSTRNIMTIEDPVEYELRGIRQSQVNERAGLSFALGLRSLLRQDPDVILVGEIRDADTMEIALRAALTGHLVLSTLHTNEAAGAIPRLVNMGAEPFLLGSTISGVMAQRLVRILCPACKEPAELSPAEEEAFRRFGIELTPAVRDKIRQPVGCPVCDDTGFRGRAAVFEMLEVTPEVQQLILKGADAVEIREKARELGMARMADEGFGRVLAGETTVEEVLKVAT